MIGSPFAGRNRTELESMVGYFINPLALRIDLSGDPTFDELIERARTTRRSRPSRTRTFPTRRVVSATNPERDLSQTPVFQAMIVLHNPAWQTQRPKFEPEGVRCAEIIAREGLGEVRRAARHERAHHGPEHDLGVQHRAVPAGDGAAHDGALPRADRERGERSATGRLSQLSMLSEGERAKVLVSWNAQHRSAAASGSRSRSCSRSRSSARPTRRRSCSASSG